MGKRRRKVAARRPVKRSREVRGLSRSTSAASEAQHEPIELKDTLVEQALASGEHAGLLEDYFGPAQHAELTQLAQEAAARRARAGERVLILPGIMGSKLGYDGPGPFDDVIWANPVEIALGRLDELSLDGQHPKIEALGVILFAYLKLKLKLRIAGYDADFFSYDWRLDLIGLGKKLAAQIKSEGPRVHLVAHSMGGLVARSALLEKPTGLERIVMLGTPNFGSFAPIQAFRGQYSIANKVAFIDLRHSKEDLAKIFCTFPGLCEMIPSPEKYAQNFFELSSWPANGVRPAQSALAAALKTDRELPTDYDQLYIIAGVDQETVVNASVANDEFVYTTSTVGDGTVPLQCVLLPTAQKIYYVAESHGSLPNNADVERAVDAILATGETSILQTAYQARRTAPLRTLRERDLDVPPYQGNRGRALSTAEKRKLIEEVAAPAPAAVDVFARPALPAAGVAAPVPVEATVMADSVVIGRRRQHRLDVTLAFGSITEVEADAYVLGIFDTVAPGGAAMAIDLLLGGAITQMSMRRMFNSAVGGISILPTGKHPVRATVVAFAGLGSFDTFKAETLEVVGENLVRTFVNSRIDDFATVPIGGASGAFTPDALFRLMTGFLRGLTDADIEHHFRGITICETDRERFRALRAEFYRLCGTKLFDGVEVTLHEVELAPAAELVSRREAVPQAPQNVFLIVRDETRLDNGTIEYGCSVLTAGSTAAVYKARQQINKKALDRLLAQLATERGLTLSQIQNFGSNVTRLVLPESINSILARYLENPLVVVHDAASSRIPWETLIIDDKFPALEAGLAHRYEAEELAIAKWLEERQRKSTLQVLLVVNPTGDLTGAEAEGDRIRSIFDKLGPAVSVRDMRGEKARKQEVLRCLASGQFDVIHYAGHAFFDQINPSKSGILCAGREVLAGADLVSLGSLPSLAFFNACESGKVRRGATTAKIDRNLTTEHRVKRGASFAEAFLRGGIANYIGTYWPVGDDAALTFAQTFYPLLLAGKPLGGALLAGRGKVRETGSADWADYIFYGDPAFVLKMPATGGPAATP
jgi:CHAT domain-containing protein/pimeloyl-ACP methyl ester carboxylesterase